MKGRCVLDNMREICLALPDTKETLTWGQPHFRVSRAPYVGHKGWVSMGARCGDDWVEAPALVLESYRLIAPKARRS